MSKLKTILFYLVLGSMILWLSCDGEGGLGFCPQGPFTGTLKVKVTINKENPEVELVIYRGVIEKGDTVIHDFVSKDSKEYKLESDVYYSGSVVYKDGIRTVIAINGKRLENQTDEDDCEYGGYNRLNLKLAR